MALTKLSSLKGRYNDMLWIPKARANIEVLKNTLTFQTATGAELVAWEETATHLVVPRATIPYEEWGGLPFTVENTAFADFPEVRGVDLTFPLRDEQRPAWKALVEGGSGILCLACGKGKTVVALHAWAAVGHPMMVVVDNSSLLDQWRERVLEHTNVNEENIGIIKEGQLDWDKPIVIASMQTLFRRVENGEWPEEAARHFGIICYDEVQVLGAQKFNLTANLGHGHRWGLSATWKRSDGLTAMYQNHLGPVLYTDLEQEITPDVFFIRTGRKWGTANDAASRDVRKEFNIGKFYVELTNDDGRNDLIVDLCDQALSDGHQILALSHSRDHIETLGERYGGKSAAIHGGVPWQKRKGMLDENDLVFAVTSLAYKGLDKPALTVLMVLTPLKDLNWVQQMTGRVQRETEDKKHAMVIVLLDENVHYAQSMCRRMMAVFTEHGIPFRVIDP